MYRILCPDGHWIAVSVTDDECNLLSLDGAQDSPIAQRGSQMTAGRSLYLPMELPVQSPQPN